MNVIVSLKPGSNSTYTAIRRKRRQHEQLVAAIPAICNQRDSINDSLGKRTSKLDQLNATVAAGASTRKDAPESPKTAAH